MSAIGKADLPGKGSVAGSREYDPGAYELLKTIDDPAALRALDRRGLQRLADELRTFILESVSQTGGHLSSNLGTVELTIALHHVFTTPYDRIVWDVGHQTYPHKILTGRREAMSRIRMSGGISGFPRRSESDYDTFGTAHSSTSVSAALGMAQAAKLKGETGEESGGESPCRRSAAVEPGEKNGRARQGPGRAFDIVRGVRVQLRRPDRRSRSGLAHSDAEEHQGAERPAVPARGHQERAGLQARRGRPGALPRPGQVRSRGRDQEGERRQADLHAGVRRMVVRHGAARYASRRHHAGDARGFGPGALRRRISREILRRGNRRAARGHLRRGARLRGLEAGARDLLDFSATRLRSADPRRLHPEPSDRVCPRPGGPGGRRRSDAQRRVRPDLSALHSQHGRDDPERRERMPPDVVYSPLTRSAGRGALSARWRPRRGRRKGDAGAASRQGRAAPPRPRRRRDPRLRQLA